ncbi:DNA primase [Beijerinckiaceae bacterium RH AL1]|nr:DNA primase [Beijerinckiaceae bacterium RH AL8]VVB43010.1 DNA primase [Beijerinckiaceae bacterium RH CH11]VVC53613.1 DNA primase [Beijerinckiaceae bacterium RH AL1]
MRFPPSFLDEIKARLPVSEVVRSRVKLKKSGREWVGLSPFGTEKTPSFFVNDAKMAWFDFSSGKNGNVFDFVMETEGLTFPETVERLAAEAGLTLPARSPEREREEARRATLGEVVEWAAAFFEAELRSARGAAARAYLDQRGISAASRTEFRIGYAPADRHALRDALAAKGASVEAMCETGLLIHGEGIAVPYDRFRDRIMFPISDRNGRTIAFGGRALAKDAQAKYLNSPETPLFHKGAGLFSHHRARKASHDKGRVIVVEGYIDVVAMHAAGFPETVATLGTAMTEEQAGLLWQMAPQPILCFDGDKAGRKAAHRAAEMALPLVTAERTLAFALLPGGHDPDELIRASGPAAMSEALAHAMPLVDLVWSRETEGRPLTTPEQRAALRNDLRALAGTIRDRGLAEYYWAAFSERLRELFGGARDARAQAPRQGGQPFRRPNPWERTGLLSQPVHASPSLASSPLFQHGGVPPREAMILNILLAWPTLAAEKTEPIAALQLSSPDLEQLRDRLLDLVHDEDPGDRVALRAALADEGFGPTLARLARSEQASFWYLRPEAPPRDVAELLNQALTLHFVTHVLVRELAASQAELAEDQSEDALDRLRLIQEQINALPGKEAAIDGFGSGIGRVVASSV